VRQLVNNAGEVTVAKSYSPYGEVVSSVGSGSSVYAYTGEQQDASGLTYLRARYYNSADGRFLTKDPSRAERNLYLYTMGNPVNYFDPSGYITENQANKAEVLRDKLKMYGVIVVKDWGYRKFLDRMTFVPFCEWQNGRWSLNELEILKFTIKQVDAKMNGQFSRLINPIEVIKAEKSPCGGGWRGCTSYSGNKIWLNDSGKPSTNQDMWQNIIVDSTAQNFDVFSIVHEIGHVWDQQNGQSLSTGLMAYTNGRYLTRGPRALLKCDANNKKPGCNAAKYFYEGTPLFGAGGTFNAQEDFANSFAVYIFPTQTQNRVQLKYSDPQNELHDYLYWELSDLHTMPRWLYIDHHINGTPLP
jgi:RHS repeat-associated protein